MSKLWAFVEGLFRMIILLGFIIFLLYLVFTRQLNLYVNPLFEIFVETSIVVLVVMCMSQMLDLSDIILASKKKQCTPAGIIGFIPFLVVLSLALLVPNNTLSATLVDSKGLNVGIAMEVTKTDSAGYQDLSEINSVTTGQNVQRAVVNTEDSNVIKNQAPSLNRAQDRIIDKSMEERVNIKAVEALTIEVKPDDNDANRVNKPLTAATSYFKPSNRSASQETRRSAPVVTQVQLNVSQENFVDTIHSIYENQQAYLNKDITISGFVYKSPNFNDDQFVLVRYLITCCTADASPYGLFSETKEAGQYNQGDWITVQGVVTTTKINNIDNPAIAVSSIQRIEKPLNPYVYLTTSPARLMADQEKAGI